MSALSAQWSRLLIHVGAFIAFPPEDAAPEMASSLQQTAGAKTNRSIEVVPLTLHIGAEIRGADLAKALPPDQLKEVREAFLKWKVHRGPADPVRGGGTADVGSRVVAAPSTPSPQLKLPQSSMSD